MFQSRSQKGLFTFYWQQCNPNNNSETLSFRKSIKALEQEDGIAENHSLKIEEHTRKKKSVRKPRYQQKTQKLQFTQVHSITSKDNKMPRPILKIDLSSVLSKEIEERAFRLVTNKEAKQHKQKITVHSHKKSHCQLPALAKQDTSRKENILKTSRGKNIVDSLIMGEQALEPSKLNIKIAEEFQAAQKEEKVLRTNRVKKTRQSDKNFKMLKKTQRNNKFLGEHFKGSKETPTYRFPMLGPSPTKRKNSRQPFLIQQIVMDRSQINRSNSSVVLLGISQEDDHRVRWQKRKQQFLGMLSRNQSCNGKQ